MCRIAQIFMPLIVTITLRAAYRQIVYKVIATFVHYNPFYEIFLNHFFYPGPIYKC